MKGGMENRTICWTTSIISVKEANFDATTLQYFEMKNMINPLYSINIAVSLYPFLDISFQLSQRKKNIPIASIYFSSSVWN